MSRKICPGALLSVDCHHVYGYFGMSRLRLALEGKGSGFDVVLSWDDMCVFVTTFAGVRVGTVWRDAIDVHLVLVMGRLCFIDTYPGQQIGAMFRVISP